MKFSHTENEVRNRGALPPYLTALESSKAHLGGAVPAQPSEILKTTQSSAEQRPTTLGRAPYYAGHTSRKDASSSKRPRKSHELITFILIMLMCVGCHSRTVKEALNHMTEEISKINLFLHTMEKHGNGLETDLEYIKSFLEGMELEAITKAINRMHKIVKFAKTASQLAETVRRDVNLLSDHVPAYIEYTKKATKRAPRLAMLQDMEEAIEVHQEEPEMKEPGPEMELVQSAPEEADSASGRRSSSPPTSADSNRSRRRRAPTREVERAEPRRRDSKAMQRTFSKDTGRHAPLRRIHGSPEQRGSSSGDVYNIMPQRDLRSRSAIPRGAPRRPPSSAPHRDVNGRQYSAEPQFWGRRSDHRSASKQGMRVENPGTAVSRRNSNSPVKRRRGPPRHGSGVTHVQRFQETVSRDSAGRASRAVSKKHLHRIKSRHASIDDDVNANEIRVLLDLGQRGPKNKTNTKLVIGSADK